MKKIILLSFITFFFLQKNQAQSVQYQYMQDAEFGVSAGVAHYFGDLNNRAAINRPKASIGAFYRKQFGNYIGVRFSGHFAQLGYSDIYSSNEYQQRRNLSFNTNIFEVAMHGDFNFFNFLPTDGYRSFTPYASIGIGLFNFDPYAYYDGQKVYLSPLNTEGETTYKNRKAYGSIAVCFPIGFGIKYAVSNKINISFEISHRFTTTDYIDDVSTTYIGADKFPDVNGQKSLAAIMQDRSNETGSFPIGIEGRQRGFSKQKDQFTTAEIGISFNIISYRCPTSR